MSKYTSELRFAFPDGLNSVLTAGSYPIFDAAYRETLNAKIYNHYKFREIGLETPGLFAVYLKRKLVEIMPYYNQLYLTQLAGVDFMASMDLTKTSTRATEGNTTQKSESATEAASLDENLTVNSDTPSGMLDDINANKYASSAAHITGSQDSAASTENSSETTAASSEEYVETLKGRHGSQTPAEMVEGWRKTLINLDMLIIKDLGSLFMSIY